MSLNPSPKLSETLVHTGYLTPILLLFSRESIPCKGAKMGVFDTEVHLPGPLQPVLEASVGDAIPLKGIIQPGSGDESNHHDIA